MRHTMATLNKHTGKTAVFVGRHELFEEDQYIIVLDRNEVEMKVTIETVTSEHRSIVPMSDIEYL